MRRLSITREDNTQDREGVDGRVDTVGQNPGLESVKPSVSGLSEQIALVLEEAILLGKVKSGERLVEATIAMEMGTSNGPVRDAFRELENLGLVISVPRRGTFVAEFNVQLAREVFSLRALLEVAALRSIFPDLRDRDVDRFEDVLNEMGRFPGGPASAPRGLVKTDLLFHDILFDLSQHRLLKQSWERLRVQARVLLVVTGVLDKNPPNTERERAISMYETHKPLVETLRARDEATAAHVFVEHLAEGERRIVKKLSPLADSNESLSRRLFHGSRFQD